MINLRPPYSLRRANKVEQSEKYWNRGQSCPVAVTLGGDPLLVEVGGTRIQWGMAEDDYADWLNNEPIEVIMENV